MSTVKNVFKLLTFSFIVVSLVSCEEDHAISATDEGSEGSKPVKCSRLSDTGTISPDSLVGAWRLPNGRRAVVDNRRVLSAQESVTAVPMTFKFREACSQVYNTLQGSNESGYEGRNPLLAADSSHSYARVLSIDDSEVRALPTTYRGIEIQAKVYEEVEVTCQGKRSEKPKVVKRLRPQLAPVFLRCAYPASYQADIPHLVVQRNASVPDVQKICLKTNVFKPDRCAEEHVAIGGIYRVINESGLSKPSATVALAWSIHRPNVSRIESSMRTALGLRSADPLKLYVPAESIASDDAFPIRAIGFSANGRIDGVKYWGLTYPHTPSNLDLKERAMTPMLPQADANLGLPNAEAEATRASNLWKNLIRSVATSRDLTPWERATNILPSGSIEEMQSLIVGNQFGHVMQSSLELGKPLSVYLVWSPTDDGRAVLTEVMVSPDGRLERIVSKFLDVPEEIGLPADLLRL